MFLINFIRSLAFSICMIFLTITYGTFCWFVGFSSNEKMKYKIITVWQNLLLWFLKVLCGVRLEVTGRENIPAQNGIIMCKHQSTMETLALPSIFDSPVIVLKKELLKIPFFGWGLRLLGPIAIDRNNPANAMEQVVKQGKKKLSEGRWILLFPEGTRTAPGSKPKYKIGGAVLAEQMQALVIPVAHNAGEHWPKKGFIKKPGVVKMVIGKPFDAKDMRPQDILRKSRNWIEETMEEISEVE